MASTPTSQITRVLNPSAIGAPAANVLANARFQTTSYLVQGATQGGDGSTLRLEAEKVMQIHSSGLTAA